MALLSQDVGRADEFVVDILCELARADPVLHLTLRTYFDQQCNAARVAECLYTHRNAVARQLAHCEELLPRLLAHDPVSVGASLHLLSWSEPKE